MRWIFFFFSFFARGIVTAGKVGQWGRGAYLMRIIVEGWG